ncbi:MAG: Glu/Leu/Phe/Val dehydrogenase [Actinobacteria bacterium]|nr:Glu/Leu/Phe/Val dehydrogenase [Actinomycetota bacterium]
MQDHARTDRIIRYVDRVEGFHGFLAIAGHGHRLAAGGCRVVPGLNEGTIVALAEAMALKQRLLGLAVDGAKAGIDYDPQAPGKREALRRFLRFLRPHLQERYSAGPDRGTTWEELEGLAREEGMVSVKGAVARAQELDEPEFRRRLAVLDVDVNGLTVGQRRAGHALAHAAIAACRQQSVNRPLVAAIQGFGNLGRGAALALAEAGVMIAAVSDEHASVTSDDGIDVRALLGSPPGAALAEAAAGRARTEAREAVLQAPVDVLVLAAVRDAVTLTQARALPATAVAVGANLGLRPSVEELLHRRGVEVVPDFVAGSGGSASMDALFGPPLCPDAGQVLSATAAVLGELVHEVMGRARAGDIRPREAAMAMSRSRVPPGKPYGRARRVAAAGATAGGARG